MVISLRSPYMFLLTVVHVLYTAITVTRVYYIAKIEELKLIVRSKTLGTCIGASMNLRMGRAETECDGTRKRTGGEVKGKKANGGGSQQSCTVSDTVYPALLPLMRTPRLPAAE